ncbi:geranylgeranyl diphosphate reductase [Telmatospirillum siberiense]|uniref:Geranylgeranyl diphosphate reductase n=1 Tax=Telmatospirillum siberiense TaxID=382514 RepID=A0A2N3PTC0_9PROT|nr:geranylgeranyl diphosphate reductase [Telmatospirillum siberiense]PKU23655.1 geranylgeranyl diphosphate reductase [Telmatospirillum siberiense]
MTIGDTLFDVVVVGGGPAGATAANDLARSGLKVALLDRAGRVKPCGGAVPPRLLKDFDIPDDLLVARVRSARIIAPSHRMIDMPIEGGFVGMVDRASFDPWLRRRAAASGAVLFRGAFLRIDRDDDGLPQVVYRASPAGGEEGAVRLRTKVVIGADGAMSQVARQEIPGRGHTKTVFAYHEIIRTPQLCDGLFDGTRCDIYYQGVISPDFYGWIFPHGDIVSVGVGSARKGFSLRKSVQTLRAAAGLTSCETLRREGAPIPARPLKTWDNGKDVILAGDAAGVVAPASGEGIYYAMSGGRLAAEAVHAFLVTGDPYCLAQARRRFMKAHGLVFGILGILQYVWYSSDARRERFVAMCANPDVQRLTWESYMNKELARSRPGVHLRILFHDIAHLLGMAKT